MISTGRNLRFVQTQSSSGWFCLSRCVSCCRQAPRTQDSSLSAFELELTHAGCFERAGSLYPSDTGASQGPSRLRQGTRRRVRPGLTHRGALSARAAGVLTHPPQSEGFGAWLRASWSWTVLVTPLRAED